MSQPLPILPSDDDARRHNDLLHSAIVESLHLAAAVCNAKYAVARIVGLPPIATTDEDADPAREKLAVELVDSSGRNRGKLSVVEGQPNLPQLIAAGRQLTNILELNDSAQTWKQELEQVRPLLDQAVVAIYSIHNGRFSYVNSRFADTLGYTRDELRALHSFDELVVPEERSRVREMVRQRFDGESRHVRYVTKIRTREGNVMDTEIHGSVAVVGGGRLVIGTAFDVTARVAAEKELREQEEFLRIITDNIADVVLIVGANGEIRYISGSIKRVLGYDIAESRGQEAFETVHPDDAAALEQHLKTFANARQFEPAAFRFRHKNGSWRTLELRGTNLLTHPQICGWLINASDITERKRLEQELEQLNRLTSLGRLAAQVAHEFNNVLMGIQTPVDLIRRRTNADPQLMRLAEMVGASIARGKRITADILRFGRPAQLTFESVDARDFLEKLADEVGPLLPAGIDLRLQFANAPLQIDADHIQLAQALLNLALNARDAMHERGGTLMIGVRPGADHTAHAIVDLPNSGEFVHINISDTGCGIAQEDLPYIFEPLFTTKKIGTGLGLSVVYQVVAAHGGHIYVETKCGQGTTFHLFLRRAAQKCAAQAIRADTKKNKNRPKPRILIVEDEATIATGLQWILEAEGMTVHVVNMAREILPAIERFEPDLMLLDISLPDADGRFVYRELVHRLPIIFSTGSYDEREFFPEGHEHATVLVKPFSTEELLRTIYQTIAPEDVN